MANLHLTARVGQGHDAAASVVAAVDGATARVADAGREARDLHAAVRALAAGVESRLGQLTRLLTLRGGPVEPAPPLVDNTAAPESSASVESSAAEAPARSSTSSSGLGIMPGEAPKPSLNKTTAVALFLASMKNRGEPDPKMKAADKTRVKEITAWFRAFASAEEEAILFPQLRGLEPDNGARRRIASALQMLVMEYLAECYTEAGLPVSPALTLNQGRTGPKKPLAGCSIENVLRKKVEGRKLEPPSKAAAKAFRALASQRAEAAPPASKRKRGSGGGGDGSSSSSSSSSTSGGGGGGGGGGGLGGAWAAVRSAGMIWGRGVAAEAPVGGTEGEVRSPMHN